MAQQQAEIQAIADNPAAPTFDNTIVAMEKSGQLLDRATSAFYGVTGANTNPTSAEDQNHRSSQNGRACTISSISTRSSSRAWPRSTSNAPRFKLDPESLRLVERYYDDFVHAGANLSEADKTELKKLNEEMSTLSDAFNTKLLAATKDGRVCHYRQIRAGRPLRCAHCGAAQSAKDRKVEGFVIPLQNTTQQPDLASLSNRATRQAIFEHSWNRAERGDANDTRDTIAHLAQLRAQKAKLLGFPSFAAWKLEDQMAKTPEAALQFMDAIVPAATAQGRRAKPRTFRRSLTRRRAASKSRPTIGISTLSKYAKLATISTTPQVKPYFELDNVLQNGVFYAANAALRNHLSKSATTFPFTSPMSASSKFSTPMANTSLFSTATTSSATTKMAERGCPSSSGQSRLLGTSPVVYNVANLPKPAAGEPALISFTDVVTMFHEFGHALHGMFSECRVSDSLPAPRRLATSSNFLRSSMSTGPAYPAIFAHYREALQDRRADAGRTGREDQEGGNLQQRI